jgi:hypothetical protein
MSMEHDDAAALGDAELAAAIAAQKSAIAAFEAEFVPMRQRYERLRQQLRRLDAEVARRAALAEGQAPARPAQRRGGTLVSDVLGGRAGVDRAQPLAHYRFYSLGRQEVYHDREGRAAAQAISLYNAEDRAQRLAHTFDEVERLRAEGLVLGVPGVPLERQGVYYVAEAKPGWLRLDQIYVEEPSL